MRKTLYIFSITSGFIVLVWMALGFCWTQRRWVSDEEKIRIAVANNLRLHRLGMERDRVYSSPEDVMQQNPNCCRITKRGNPDSATGIFAVGSVEVKVRYKISAKDETTYYDSYSIIECCGRILRTEGTVYPAR
jgi:hypothetical protein